MAIPPGNKQVGQVMVAATYSIGTNITQITMHNYSMVACVVDTSRVYTQQQHKNLQVGAVSLHLTSGIAANSQSITLHQFCAVAVLRYDPPTSINLQQFTVTPVLVDLVQAARPVKGVNNLMIGNAAAAVTVGIPQDIALIEIEQFLVVAVVREFHPRKEHTTITIEYGAEAKLNIGDNS